MILDTSQTWKDVLDSIKVSVSPANFSTWFSQTHLVAVNKNQERSFVEVGCNSSFVKATLESRYFGLIQDSLIKTLGTPCDLIFVVKQNPAKTTQPDQFSSPLFEQIPDQAINKETAKKRILESGLRLMFNFKNFAVSSSNQMAFAAAEAVASDPGNAYNPLFIWGGVGVGKTHLMSAVGYSILEKDPEMDVVLCTGEQFTNEIVEGIRNKSTQQFRRKYRKAKALLIDDIQFIAGKDAVQEEFFHTFNALVNSGAQVILTSDRPPSEISKLEERLRSRFEAGLIVDIAAPDFELRCAILQIKAKERSIELPMDLIQLIAANIDGARQMEGFLVKLSTEVKIKKAQVTPDLIESLLGKGAEVNGQMPTKASPNDLLNAVSKYYSLGKRSLLGNSRARPVSQPRQILMYLMRIQLGLPLEEVGRLIGGRDHTTVMHAVEKITHLASSDVEIREDIRRIKNSL